MRLVKRLSWSIILLPIRLIRRLIRILQIEEQISKVQQVGRNYSFGFGLYVGNEGEIVLGKHLEAANFAYFTTSKGGRIIIGDNCFFGDNCKIVSDRTKVSIGNNCLIAEQVSIRASNHGIASGVNIREQQNTFAPIEIGEDVWIGKGSAVLAGSRIPSGCIIGANSVVLGKSELKKNCIYVGAPVKYIASRASS